MNEHLPRALIVGAPAALAGALAAELTARGASVVGPREPGSADPGWTPAALGAALAGGPPTHVFLFENGSAPGHPTGALLDACRALAPRPRLVLVTSTGVGPRARRAERRAQWATEEAVRTSGLPFTIARPAPLRGGSCWSPAARVLAAWAGVAGALGFARTRARHRPTDVGELAHALVHAAFNYTTIDRVVGPEELRYELANDREAHVPRSRRDGPRH